MRRLPWWARVPLILGGMAGWTLLTSGGVSADAVSWVLDGLLFIGCGAVVWMTRQLRRERLQLAQLRASIGEPVVFRRVDGHITVEWPSEDTLHCLVARELLDAIVAEINAARGVS